MQCRKRVYVTSPKALNTHLTWLPMSALVDPLLDLSEVGSSLHNLVLSARPCK